MILYSTRLDDPEVRYNMTVRCNNQLRNAGFRTVGEVCLMTEEDLRRIRNMGKKSIDDIKKFLSRNGLSLGMSADEIREVPADIQEAVDTLGEVLKCYRVIASDLSKRVTELQAIESHLKRKYLIT